MVVYNIKTQYHDKSPVKTLYYFFFALTTRKKILPQAIFCRVHRSYIACLENINAFDLDEVQVNGEKIPLEKGYRNRLFSNTRIIQ
jgi:hypothetical protein